MTVLTIFGCAKVVARALGVLPFLGVPRLRVDLPVNVDFCAFRAVDCIVSICHSSTPISGGFVGFNACITLFPRLVTNPVIHCHSITRRLMGHHRALRVFAENMGLFVINLTGGMVVTGAVKALAAGVFTAASRGNIIKA